MFKIILILLIFYQSIFAETVIRFSHVVSPDSPKGMAVEYFKKDLEKTSQGKIKVLIYANGILFDDIPIIRALEKNIVQMAAPSFSKFSDKIRDFQVFDIPFLFTDEDHFRSFCRSRITDILEKQAENHGIIILDFWENGFKQITCRDKLIKTPQDLKGLRVRTMGSQILNSQFSLAGALPFTYPFSSLKHLLAEKIIDCQENTFNNIYSQKLHEYQKYITLSNHGYLGYAVVISKKFWNNLTQNERTLIQDSLKKATEFEKSITQNLNYIDYFRLKSNNKVVIYELSPSEKKIWEDFYRKHKQIFYNHLSAEIQKELENMGL
ncbi:MAG: DctP family TRAP transporter solute-binding subunit [Calditerrivibrio sp.]|nr:DctP family TRAP transporter solute-binding subunit [Calditerrivibrio sp.]